MDDGICWGSGGGGGAADPGPVPCVLLARPQGDSRDRGGTMAVARRNGRMPLYVPPVHHSDGYQTPPPLAPRPSPLR